MSTRYVPVFSILCLLMGWFPLDGLSIQVGVAVEKINVPKDLKMWGYEHRVDSWIGEWDPLLMKALVFDDGKTKVVMVVLDLGRTPPEKELTHIQREVNARYAIPNCLIMATHTHAGPVLGVRSSAMGWEEALADAIVALVGKADQGRTEAFLSTAEGTADITYERRKVKEDGSIQMLWQNYEREPVAPIDQTVRLVFIRDAKGESVATLVHYACHPVVGGNKNVKLSGDIPAAVSSYVEENLGGVCLFMQGACGNINPYMAAQLTTQTGYESVLREGWIVAKEAVRLAKKSKPITGDLSIHYVSKQCEVGFKADQDEDFKELLQWMYDEKFIADVNEKRKTSFPVEIPVLVLGDSLAWAGFPGEFFDEFQVQLASRSPIAHTYFLGYCNGYYSYFPTIQAVAEGGYGARYGLIAETGAGERLLDQALIGLYEAIGKL